MRLTPLTTVTRAVLLVGGLVLGIGLAAPATAADNAPFGFLFGSGGISLSIGNGGYIGRHFAPSPPKPACLDADQLRDRLRAQGYGEISFAADFGDWMTATARRDGDEFRFNINRCTGEFANSAAGLAGPDGGLSGAFAPGFAGNANNFFPDIP